MSEQEKIDLYLNAVFRSGCTVVNSELASGPEYRQSIRNRLGDVRNDCVGDIARALKKDDSVSESTRKFANDLAKQLLAK